MRKILAIDDHIDNLTTITAVMNSYLSDCVVLTSLSGSKGVEIAQKEQPNVILLDIIMPEMDGYETFQKLKENEFTKHIPIIMLTAIKTDSRSRVKALEMGADAFLSKPIDPVELAAQVKVILRIKTAEDKLRAENEKLEVLVSDRTTELTNKNEKLVYEIIQRKKAEETLQTIVTSFSAVSGLEFFEKVALHIVKSLQVKIAFVGEILENGKAIIVKAGIENGKPLKLFEYDIQNTPCENVVDGSICSYPSNVQLVFPKDHLLMQLNIQSYVGVPLIARNGKTLGVLVILNDEPIINEEFAKSMLQIFSERVSSEMERGQTEQALQESEEKYRHLVDRANDGICIVQDNIVKYANSYLGKLWGGDHLGILNNNFVKYVHPSERPKIINILKLRISGGKTPSIYETVLLNKNGGSVNVELSAGLITYLGKPADLIFIRDITDRKKAEIEIKKLSIALEQSPSIISITDLQGNFEYVNQKFTEILGYTIDEIKGLNTSVISTGIQSSEFYKNLWDTIISGKNWQGEFQNKRRNGAVIWETASISPLFDEENNITHYIKVAEDVTEQKKTQQALKESEKKYSKLIETTSEGFWLLNSKRETIEVNNSLCEFLGYSREDMLGKSPLDFVDKHNALIFENQLNQSIGKQHRNYEIILSKKDGTLAHSLFNATSITDNNGVFAGSFAFVTDITKIKHAELVQKILFNISNAVNKPDNLNKLIATIQSELGKIIDTSNFYVALYDQETDIISFPFHSDEKDLFIPIPSPRTLTKYVIETKKPLLANLEIKEKLIEEGKLITSGSSSKIWLGVPLEIDGKVIGAFAVQSYTDENAYDESDMEMLEFVSDQISLSIYRKKAVEDLKYALEKATESDRLKTAFLQNVSHEIRTPMNGILGFSSLLKNHNLTGEEQQSYINIISSSGNRMLTTLNDLMDISMLETDQMKLKISSTNINEELALLYDFFKPEVEKKGLEISYLAPLSNELVNINTDRQKFYAILTNLIKNAIKYTHKGNIEFGYLKKQDFLEFYVKDSGIGIPENRQSAIFERFVQADIADVKVYEGSGLGLSISQAYVELLGGKLWVDSIEKIGSQFYFTMPFDSDELDDNKSDINYSKFQSYDGINNLKILIAEDEDVAFEYLSIIIENISAEIIRAKNGLEVIEFINENPDVDLILMDIKMPKMGGYEATSEIRKFNKDILIIAQTAYALEGDSKNAIDSGCDFYISKPIDKDHLMDIIKEGLIKKNNL